MCFSLRKTPFSSLINIISLDVTSFNSAVMLKLKCGKVVCVEFFIFGDHSSVAYRATENLSRYCYHYYYYYLQQGGYVFGIVALSLFVCL